MHSAPGPCDRRLARELPGPRQRRLPPGQGDAGQRPALRPVPGARRRRARLAIVVVDSCMMPRDLLDRAKELARQNGRHPHRPDADLGHAHPLRPGGDGRAGMPGRSCLCRACCRGGSPRHREAVANLVPARVAGASSTTTGTPSAGAGFAAPTGCSTTPSAQTVRANMHPGMSNPDAIAPPARSTRPDRPVGPDHRGPAPRRPGQLLAALLRGVAGLGRLLRPVRRRLCQAIGAERGSPPSSASCRRAPAATRCGWTTARPQERPGTRRLRGRGRRSAVPRPTRRIAEYHDRVPLPWPRPR